MAHGMDFWKPKLGEYTDPSSLCLCQYPPEVHATGWHEVSSGNGLNFITNDAFLLLKYDIN